MFANLLPPLLLLGVVVVIGQVNTVNHDKIIDDMRESMFGLDDSNLPETHTHEMNELLHNLRFEPQKIDFGSWSVGQARTQLITLFNQNNNRSVQLFSISGPTPAFYSSFFETREVPPKGNTTLNVVFLPRELGAITTDLHIHTSFGRTEISVHGVGRECPYRLKPLVGIKAPINASLAPEVYMYNPHERPLQILEVYSSGGEFQLELPSGEQQGPQKLWQIPPYSAKPVIRVSFNANTVGNHTAYIRIKIAEPSDDAHDTSENILVIPVEFEILPKPTAYARNPLADFGRISTGGSSAQPMRFRLDIHSLKSNKREQVKARSLRDIPGLTFDEKNANVVLDPKMFEQSTLLEDYFLMHSNDDTIVPEKVQEFSVLVRAEIYKGDLYYDRNVTLFATSAPELETERTLIVRNDFQIPLMLHNVTVINPVNVSQLKISDIKQQIVLQPSESLDLLKMQLINKSAEFHSTLRINTNVSVFEIPMAASIGKLHVSTEDKESTSFSTLADYNTVLNLGPVPYADMSHNGFILLHNPNPMPIKITNWHFETPKGVYFTSHFLGCVSAATIANLVNQNVTLKNYKKYNICPQLNQGDVAYFQLAVKTYVTEPRTGMLKIWTPFELITVTVEFNTAVGKLSIEQDQFYFKNCFPGRVCTAELNIRSTFLQPLHLTAVNFTQSGMRFREFNAKGTKIAPQTLTKVGRLYFEPTALCGDRCYINRADRESDQNLAFSGTFDVDVLELRKRTEQYSEMRHQLQSVSLTLRCKELPPLDLDFSIEMAWPKLVVPRRDPSHPAPTTEVGHTLRQNLVISNPTQYALLVDYFLAEHKSARVTTQSSMPGEFMDASYGNCYMTDLPIFTLSNGAPKKPHLLQPGETLSVPFDFNAANPEKYCSLLHIRNNLTLYEAAWLTARSVHSQFRFGNRKPGSTTPLLFEFTEQQFDACASGTDIKAPIMKRTFTARNSGEVPIRIEGFYIGGQLCEGYGFAVNNCGSFELPENATRKIEIAFRTDFTTTRVVRPLTLKSNLSYDLNYVLTAQLPRVGLERCTAHITRPEWEFWFSKVAIVALAVTFFIVCITAFVDYREIMIHQTTLYAARHRGPVQPVFNLSNISAKIEQDPQLGDDKSDVALSAAQLRQGKYGQNNLKKRTTTNSAASNVNTNTLGKKSKWTPWNMNILMYKPQEVKRAERTKPVTTNQSTEEEINGKCASIGAVKTTPTQESKNNKKTTTQQSTRQTKKPKQSNTHQANITPPKDQWKTTCQENVSPKLQLSPQQTNALNITKQETPDEQQKVLKEQNGTSSCKKVGKTPGRERRKEPTIVNNEVAKKSERKQRNKQLNFDAAPTAAAVSSIYSDYSQPLNCITSPWETNSHVSFSDVIQAQNTNFNNIENSINEQQNGFDWTQDNVSNGGASAVQLGPIGSKKSPSSNLSIWDNVPLQANGASTSTASMFTQPLQQNQHNLLQNGSFLPNMDALPNNQFSNISAELYELQREQLRRHQYQASEFLLLQHQQRQQQLLLQQAQVQEQQRQQQQLLRNMDTANWNGINSAASTWSPLSYGAPWQNTSNVIRPPPGLATNYNSINPLSNLQANHSRATTAAATVNASVSAPVSNIVLNNEHVAAQFDPFRTLSSIWSDTWPQGQSSVSPPQRNNNYNNHMN